MASTTQTAAKHPNVGRASMIMMLSLFLSRILGIVRDIVMAHMFGSDRFTDAYRLAFQIPDLMFFLIAGGALSSAFIPVFSEYLHTEREREAWHIFSVVTSVMSVIVIAFIVFAGIFALPLAHYVAPGKDADLFPIIAQMSRIVLPAQFAFFIGGLMFGTLYARHVFTVPGLGPNVYNIGIIIGAIFLSSFCTPGVMGMSWGALLGAVVGNLVIPFFVMKKMGSHFHFSLDVKHPGVKKVFTLMIPVVLGLSLPGVYALIMQWFGSFYHAGVNTWLDYSNRLMQAPLGIFGQSLAIAVFPALTQFFAQNKMGHYRTQLSNTMRTVIYLTVPISAIMLAMAPQIVSAIYQSGKFTHDDTMHVAYALQCFSLGVSAWCLHPVLMRGFFAIQNSVVPIIIGTATTIAFVVFVLVLRPTDLGFYALPVASSAAAILLVIILTLEAMTGGLSSIIQKAAPSSRVLRWLGLTKVEKIGGLDVKGILLTLGKSLLASLVVYAIAALAAASKLEAYGHQHKLVMVLFVAVVSSVALWVYIYLTQLLQMPEREYLTRASKRRQEPITPIEAGDE